MKFLNLFYFNKVIVNWQQVIIASDNVLAPNGRRAIIWNTDGLVDWHIYVLLSLDELKLTIFFISKY